MTIQNHGGYTDFYDVDKTVDLSDYGNYPAAELYFSLLKLSDEAIAELIEYFEHESEPTMIIIYGDHQPNLGEDVDEWLSNAASEDRKQSLRKYITPFVIWTNYDIEEQYIDKISANYLPALILKIGNFQLPGFYQFLWEVYEQYPVITTAGIVDTEGRYYNNLEEVDDKTGLLNLYEQIQYNILFDNQNRIEEWFQ